MHSSRPDLDVCPVTGKTGIELVQEKIDAGDMPYPIRHVTADEASALLAEQIADQLRLT